MVVSVDIRVEIVMGVTSTGSDYPPEASSVSEVEMTCVGVVLSGHRECPHPRLGVG